MESKGPPNRNNNPPRSNPLLQKRGQQISGGEASSNEHMNQEGGNTPEWPPAGPPKGNAGSTGSMTASTTYRLDQRHSYHAPRHSRPRGGSKPRGNSKGNSRGNSRGNTRGNTRGGHFSKFDKAPSKVQNTQQANRNLQDGYRPNLQVGPRPNSFVVNQQVQHAPRVSKQQRQGVLEEVLEQLAHNTRLIG